MKKLIYSATILSALLLAACGGDEEETKENVEETTIQVSNEESKQSWDEQISELASNSDAVPDKFYALETIMMDYEATSEEVEQFKNEIVADYKSGSYLSELENHERMLSNIFKSYIVEQNTEGSTKEFAFDYHQIVKYTYRGAEAIDSDFVKENEYQIEKSLKNL